MRGGDSGPRTPRAGTGRTWPRPARARMRAGRGSLAADLDWSAVECGRLQAAEGRWAGAEPLIARVLEAPPEQDTFGHAVLAVMSGRAALRRADAAAAGERLARAE